MKQTITIFLLVAGCFTGLFAQSNFPAKLQKLRVPNNIPQRTTHGSQVRDDAFYLDYDYSDYLLWGGDVDPNAYQAFIWNMNMRYKVAEGDTNWTYAVVGFNNFYNYNTGETYDQSTIEKITIDSVFVNLGQMNISGQTDTLIVRIIKLSTTGYPTASTLKADTLVIDVGLSSDNSWLTSGTLPIGYDPPITTTDKRFGVRVEYYDPSKMDTLGLIAGWGDNGPCGTFGFDKAAPSNFAPNSYTYWMRYGQLLPQSGGGDVYYDCNSNGQFDEGDDGVNFMQNWQIWSHIYLNYGVGIDDPTGDIGQLSFSPNPTSNESQILYTLKNAGDVTINLTDVTGRVIQTVFSGYRTEGKQHQKINTIDLANGVYMLTVNSGNSNTSQKFVVSH